MVSVIVTAYNAEAYIAEAVESVLNQTVPPGEVIVVDDGSQDGTGEVLRRFEGRIRYVHQDNQGQGAAINTGIALAQGSLLGFIDGDDLWTPTKLEAQLAALEADPSLELVYGLTRQFRSPELAPSVAETLACDDRLQPSPLISGLLARRSVFDRVGVFKVDNVATCLDWYLRTREAGIRQAYPDHHITWRRVHASNTTLKRGQIGKDYLQQLKASLDRRRASGVGAKPMVSGK